MTRQPGFLAPPETAVLTPRQLAAWLQVSERQLDRLEGMPCVYVGGARSKRYVVRDVLEWLHAQAARGRPPCVR